ncbi:hypothetical protein ACLBWP_05465 [Microbacterium sp. M1A1_1b]
MQYVDVFVFDHGANRRDDAWHWPRVRTESMESRDTPVDALERAALEFMQNVLRGDSIDEDVMLAVERESEHRLRASPRSGTMLTLNGRSVRGRRISWGDYWFTGVDTGDPAVTVLVLGPTSWAPQLERIPS